MGEHQGEPLNIDEEDEVIKTESVGALKTEEGPSELDEDYDVYGMDPETGERVGYESYNLGKFEETVEGHKFAYEDDNKFVKEEDPIAADADDEAEVLDFRAAAMTN